MTRVTITDALPAVLSTTELASVLGLSRSRVWQLERSGALRFLELDPRICERARYSGRRVRAYLDGELATASAPAASPTAPTESPHATSPRVPSAPATTRRHYFGSARQRTTAQQRTEP